MGQVRYSSRLHTNTDTKKNTKEDGGIIENLLWIILMKNDWRLKLFKSDSKQKKQLLETQDLASDINW